MTASIVLHPMSTGPTEAAVVTVEAGAIGAHVGLLFLAGADGARRHLHLAWHMRLEDEPAPPSDALWVAPRLKEQQLDDVAISAHLIAARQRDGRVPYAFDPANARFASDGTLQLNQSIGLTCATFVMLVFEYAGIELLEKTSWDQERSAERRHEDAGAQRALVRYLRDNPESQSHAALVEREVGCTRFRAEEVAATSGMAGHPVRFARAEAAGRRVLDMVRRQRAGIA